MCDLLLLTPADTLQFRGNRRFAAGVYGTALMPPWPSVFAGAIRSATLANRAVPFRDFLAGRTSDAEVAAEIGASPRSLGTFRVGGVALARRSPATPGSILPRDTFVPLPSDLVAFEEDGSLVASSVEPLAVSRVAIHCASDAAHGLPSLRRVRSRSRTAVADCWISLAGLDAHLSGHQVASGEVVKPSALYSSDSRLGIALDGEARAASPGLLYTTEEISLRSGLGFLIPVWGATKTLPRNSLARLGGDGRGVRVEGIEPAPGTPHLASRSLPPGPHFRIVLATPGIFATTTGEMGWLPPGVKAEAGRFILRRGDLAAELVAAAINRPQVVSGWDLARGGPKPALRAVPAGAVYWFRNLNPEAPDLSALADWIERGLWPDCGTDPARRAEGFNSIWLGEWTPSDPRILESREA